MITAVVELGTDTVALYRGTNMKHDSTKETLVHIRRVSALLHTFCIELMDRADDHDASKLVHPEKKVFDEFTPKLKETTYGSAEYQGFLKQMDVGLKNHYAANSHHPEHHRDGINSMSLFDLVEMFCDWKAASERHADGDIHKSIIANKKRFGMSDQLVRIFQNTTRSV